MPYYDLNVPWAAGEAQLQRTIAFLDERYNVIALSHTLSGKLPSDLVYSFRSLCLHVEYDQPANEKAQSCPIPQKLPFQVPSKTHVLRRCTLVLSDPSQNHRIASLSANYDILALRPTNEKSLQQACQSLDCDIISIDMTQRLDYHFKMKMLSQAIERGIKLEICYSPAMLTTDANARRNLISNATQLIRATRSRGIIISSETTRAAGCRGPDDVVNLAAVWGLGQERGKEGLTKLARHAVVSSQMKRTSFRGVVDIVNGGNTVNANKKKGEEQQQQQQAKKRKANSLESIDEKRSGNAIVAPKALSKREQKRQRKAAAQQQQQQQQE